jgi:hypothetical protein
MLKPQKYFFNTILVFGFCLLFIKPVFAQHIGCVNLYEQKICEEENHYSFSSEDINWRITKEEFQEKIRTTISNYFSIATPAVVDVHFWVNDFNTLKSIKLQVWSQEKKFMLSFPVDLSLWGHREKVSLRRMGSVPYPLDYGYQFGELIVTCVESCQKAQFDFLQKWSPLITYQQVTSDVLVLKVPDWQEELWMEVLQKQPDYATVFKDMSLSPVLEANGFSQLSFRFILRSK